MHPRRRGAPGAAADRSDRRHGKFPKYPQEQRPGLLRGHRRRHVACNGHQRGNFGQLDSPRNDSSQKQTVYARNVAFGLDHELAAFATEPSAVTSARADGTPASAPSSTTTRPPTGNNCLYVDPGNDPQGLTDGLLGGGRINEGEGRLAEADQPALRDARTTSLVIGGKTTTTTRCRASSSPATPWPTSPRTRASPTTRSDTEHLRLSAVLLRAGGLAGRPDAEEVPRDQDVRAGVPHRRDGDSSAASATNGLIAEPRRQGAVRADLRLQRDRDAHPAERRHDGLPRGHPQVIRLIK